VPAKAFLGFLEVVHPLDPQFARIYLSRVHDLSSGLVFVDLSEPFFCTLLGNFGACPTKNAPREACRHISEAFGIINNI